MMRRNSIVSFSLLLSLLFSSSILNGFPRSQPFPSPSLSSLYYPFVFLCFNPLPMCLQDASAQTQQMLKGKTGTTLDAISILLKDH